MKAKSSLTLLASLVLITFIFTQCQKGDVGPAGPLVQPALLALLALPALQDLKAIQELLMLSILHG
jgi:hypothetical protein